MEFIDERSQEFWNWFTQSLSDRQRTILLLLILSAFGLVFILGDKVNSSQILVLGGLVLVVALYMLWVKRRKIALIAVILVAASCTIAALFYFTTTHRSLVRSIARAQEYERQGNYQASLAILAEAKNLFSESIAEGKVSADASLCLVSLAQIEIILGKWDEAERDLNLSAQLLDNTNQCAERADIALWIGELARLRGDPIQAHAKFDDALSRYQACNNARGAADATLGLGKAASVGRHPDYVEAKKYCELADQLYSSVGNKVGQADALAAEGDVFHNTGDYDRALAKYVKARQLNEEDEYRPGQVDVHLKIGDLYSDQALWDSARSEYDQASSIAKDIKSLWRDSLSEDSLGDIEVEHGSCDVAIHHYEQSEKDALDIHWKYAVAMIRVGKGYAEIYRGNFDDAQNDLKWGLDGYHEIGNSKGEAEANIGMGELCLERHDFDRARAHFDYAMELLPKSDEPDLRAHALRGRADVERNQQLYAQATTDYQEALTLFQRVQDRKGEASVLVGEGRLAEAWHQDKDIAGKLYEQAMSIYQDKGISDRRGQARVCEAEAALLSSVDLPQARAKYQAALEHYTILGDKAKIDELTTLLSNSSRRA